MHKKRETVCCFGDIAYLLISALVNRFHQISANSSRPLIERELLHLILDGNLPDFRLVRTRAKTQIIIKSIFYIFYPDIFLGFI